MRIFASPPDEVSGLEQMDEWLHEAIRHEYVHVLHLNQSRGAPALGLNIFGRQPWFSHTYLPCAFGEGLAVYLESDAKLGYGRLTGSYLPMQMRAELQQQPDALNEVVIPLRDWPTSKSYLYGAYFGGMWRNLRPGSHRALCAGVQSAFAAVLFAGSHRTASVWQKFYRDVALTSWFGLNKMAKGGSG